MPIFPTPIDEKTEGAGVLQSLGVSNDEHQLPGATDRHIQTSLVVKKPDGSVIVSSSA